MPLLPNSNPTDSMPQTNHKTRITKCNRCKAKHYNEGKYCNACIQFYKVELKFKRKVQQEHNKDREILVKLADMIQEKKNKVIK